MGETDDGAPRPRLGPHPGISGFLAGHRFPARALVWRGCAKSYMLVLIGAVYMEGVVFFLVIVVVMRVFELNLYSMHYSICMSKKLG